jgi:hypothetical protein
MKINPTIAYSFNFKPNLNSNPNELQRPKFGLMSNPALRVLAEDQVSFVGKPSIPFFLRNVDNLPCPCCGLKMVTSVELAKFDGSVLGRSSKVAIEALSAYEDRMHPVPKACFQELKELSKKNPSKSLSELLLSVAGEHLKSLKKRQLKVVSQIGEIGKNLPSEASKALSDFTATTKNAIMDQKGSTLFTKRDLVSNLNQLKSFAQENTVLDDMRKIATEYPLYSKDADLFIVENSNRTSSEIGQRLLVPSVGTVEHIHPDSLGGAYSDKNFMLECGTDNSLRGSLPFSDFVAANPGMIHNIPKGTDLGKLSIKDWIKKHPEHKGNIQKYFDAVIEKINNGEIKGHNDYLDMVAKTIEEESKGAITPDLSTFRYGKKPVAQGHKINNVTPLMETPKPVAKESTERQKITNPFAPANFNKKKA